MQNQQLDKMSLNMGTPNMIKMYYITLYVTSGQEEAIENMYKEKKWTYLKAAAPVLPTMSPIVLPNGVGFIPNINQKHTLLNKADTSISTVTSDDKTKSTNSDDDEEEDDEDEDDDDDDEDTQDADMAVDSPETNEENTSRTIIIKKEDISQDDSFGVSKPERVKKPGSVKKPNCFNTTKPPQDDIIECDKCHLRIKETGYQRDHNLLNCSELMEKAKTENGYECKKCSTTFLTSDIYIWHILNKSCTLKLCIRCGVDDTNLEVFEKHQKTTCLSILYSTEKYDGKYMCYGCKTTFKATQVFMRHKLLGFCTGYTLTCDFCGKSFPVKRRANYNMHLRTHLNDRPYVCKECGKAYIEPKSLKNHMRKHTGEKPYKCNYCTMHFPTMAHRRGHEMSRHMDLPKSQVCHKCGMAFKFKSGLNVHLAVVHQNERNFACKICDKRFKTDGILKKHMLCHKTEKDHVCEICGKGFVSDLYLRTHMVRHTDEKNHTCEMCGKAFFTRQYLILHERIHTGDKPYKCLLCDYRCAIRGNLLKHIRGVHSKDNPTDFVELNKYTSIS